ncbi:hypothetical protein SBOR_6863 [Sclerotinia borealis F-4128]|uniref:2EXR domain-containing protein n=1 Tax=Sclerotinia borealis (strain F-4128) TaxID=1432307 RepID=W9CA76_SCLBF|nr:hypothetical protein SBOR_6863 [Sclerotinia borealis F-4128]
MNNLIHYYGHIAMDRINSYLRRGTDQVNDSASNNERNRSVATIDQATQTESSPVELINANHNIVPVHVAPRTFLQFRSFPLEVRLKIWRYAALQPRIILVSPCGTTIQGSNYLRTSWQQCPLTMACRESREVVLSIKKPVKLLRPKPDSAGTMHHQYYYAWNGLVYSIIYTNPDIDVIWLQPSDTPLGIATIAYVALSIFPGVKRLIVSGEGNFPRTHARLLGSVLPDLNRPSRLMIHSLALGHNLREIYCLLEDEGFSIDAYTRDERWLGLPRSLKEIDEGHESCFKFSRSLMLDATKTNLMRIRDTGNVNYSQLLP